MTELEYQALKTKIDKEFPVRLKLWELTGGHKLNPKNYKALEAFDATVAELFLEVALHRPDNVAEAIQLIRSIL